MDGASRASTRAPEKRAPLTGLGDLTGIRVLAIDDEEDALGLLRVVLEAAGAEVMTMASALDAIQRVVELAARRPGGRSRHAAHGRLRVHRAHSRLRRPRRA